MKRLKQKDFIKRSRIKHKNFYKYDKTIYKNYRTHLTITCPLHGDFNQKPKNHLHGGYGCYKCGLTRRNRGSVFKPSRKDRLTGKKFISLALKKHGKKYTYENVDFINTRVKVRLRCPKHGEFSQRPGDHLSGAGCRKCANDRSRINRAEFLRKAIAIHDDKYDYSKVDYTHYGCKVIIICKKHGEFKQDLNEHIRKRGIGCPTCKASRGERKIRMFLLLHNIKFIQEYKLSNSYYRYDFYLPELNLLIEYDGIQHFKPVKFFGGESVFEKIKERDKDKISLAKNMKIPLIRISYLNFKNLEEILKKKIERKIRYKKDDNYFKSFLDFCRFYNLPGDATLSDVNEYLFKLNDCPL